MLNAILVNASGLDTFINWFKDPESLLVAMGPWVLWGTMLIVLIESGVLFPVLPGESLLFTAGLLHDRLGLHLPTLIIMVVVAAFIGAQIGYFLGAKWGRKLFKPDARVLKTEHLEKAEHYFRDYGGRSLVIGRFIPFVRTFIPLGRGNCALPLQQILGVQYPGCAAMGRRLHYCRFAAGQCPLRSRQPHADLGRHHSGFGSACDH